MRRTPTDAVNQELVPVVRYGADPRSVHYIAALNGHLQTGMNGRDGRFYAGDKGAGRNTYHGAWSGTPPQRFAGAVGVQIFGSTHTNTAGDSQAGRLLAATQGSLLDPSLAVFANRDLRSRGQTLASFVSGGAV